MGTGTLTLAYLLLAAGATPDVWPINQSNIRIPIHVDPVRRPLIKQLILYASNDEGRTWNQASIATPDQEAFAFSAPTDGVYWFTVTVVDPQGNSEPKDIYKVPPSQKILIDTLKPQVKITAELLLVLAVAAEAVRAEERLGVGGELLLEMSGIRCGAQRWGQEQQDGQAA